jgi:hypothetical protein
LQRSADNNRERSGVCRFDGECIQHIVRYVELYVGSIIRRQHKQLNNDKYSNSNVEYAGDTDSERELLKDFDRLCSEDANSI